MLDSASSFVSDTVRQSTSQLAGALSQTSKFALGNVASVLSLNPMNASRSVPPLGPAKAAVKQWVDLAFEVAEQVFDLQHDLALELVDRFAVGTTGGLTG